MSLQVWILVDISPITAVKPTTKDIKPHNKRHKTPLALPVMAVSKYSAGMWKPAGRLDQFCCRQLSLCV